MTGVQGPVDTGHLFVPLVVHSHNNVNVGLSLHKCNDNDSCARSSACHYRAH